MTWLVIHSRHSLKESTSPTAQSSIAVQPLTCGWAWHRGVLKAFFIQLAIVSNHQNGRDTHLRQVKVYGPLQQSVKRLGNQMGFNTVEFSQYATVR